LPRAGHPHRGAARRILRTPRREDRGGRRRRDRGGGRASGRAEGKKRVGLGGRGLGGGAGRLGRKERHCGGVASCPSQVRTRLDPSDTLAAYPLDARNEAFARRGASDEEHGARPGIPVCVVEAAHPVAVRGEGRALGLDLGSLDEAHPSRGPDADSPTRAGCGGCGRRRTPLARRGQRRRRAAADEARSTTPGTAHRPGGSARGASHRKIAHLTLRRCDGRVERVPFEATARATRPSPVRRARTPFLPPAISMSGQQHVPVSPTRERDL